MSRLLDEQAVVKTMSKWLGYRTDAEQYPLRELLSRLPSAQPEIIRCKDCKHWREGGVYSYCQKLFNMGVLDIYDYMMAEDDFCSRAERWEEGEDDE